MDQPSSTFDQASPRVKRRFPGQREFVAMMAAMMALNALAIDAMLPAFPAIGAALDVATANDRQYVISVYIGAMGIGSLLYGPLADRYGRRPVLFTGIGVYILFSLLCALAESFTALLTFRFLQGFGAAAIGVLVTSVIRDRYSGDTMAKLMSMIFIVFMAVPVVAPTIGQAILTIAGWRWIFGVFAIAGFAVIAWVWARLPETLEPCNVKPIKPTVLANTWRMVFFNRMAMGYVLGAGLIFGGLFGFLNSSQQIFADVFDAADIFPYAFAAVAGGLALANFVNSRVVERIGARRVSHSALFAFIALSLSQIAAAYYAPESMVLFLGLATVNMAMLGFTGSNFSALAMEPFGEVAGAASSFQTFVRTVLGAIIGGSIGQFFDGTAMPMAIGFLLAGIAALALVLWCEKGKLFQRPQTCPNVPY
ncbi:multidrug effflux MFS transporter [Alterisphingorhabdus coralli]|uniref:Bcr/CflA family efflux transporter n=1 Tax=Alterisphingorhabdus coralli TaxID=3071408 RepID=A0AA97HZB2_9SPHN|nr:multidrug effflux MFS transporter [Parasphingorhabdus sp. SCSIO 66989]WOE74434.1 multidrug effflux MFS transporter [Parasphingorhabdus sp. SCSIO 66989]